MTQFNGFPVGARQTPIPNLFFTAILPHIDDIVELKVSLGLMWKLSWKKGSPRFVALGEMAADGDLLAGLRSLGADPQALLERGLEAALARGTFLHLELEKHTAVEKAGGAEHLYFLNTEADRRAIERIQRGEVDLGGRPKREPLAQAPEQRNIFSLYEENIGILTPLIAEELREAETEYPFSWIVEAFREAVRMEHRRWRYIQRILENWKAEGRSNGRPARDTQKETPSARQPDKRGGYIVKREGAQR